MSRVLATQAMLLAVGVSTHHSIPMAAVTAWVLKDGIGHLVAIAFGTLINQRFDSDPKRFRFQAATLGKLADSVSILTLHWPQYFLPLSVLGGAFSRLSTNMGASCRAKVYETFALTGNLGDIMRCSTAQSTAAQLLGTALGAAVGPFLGSNLTMLMSCSILLSLACMSCCYRATCVIQLSSLNRQRGELIFQDAAQQICRFDEKGIQPLDDLLRMPNVREVQEQEVFVSSFRSKLAFGLEVNPPMASSHCLLMSIQEAQDCAFLLAVRRQRGKAAIALWYQSKATPNDVLQGFLQASLMRQLLVQVPGNWPDGELCARAKRLSQSWWPYVREAIVCQGWNVDVLFLDMKDNRIEVL
ncbi:unnamed protein product [Effrenium voratum]|uniref:Uncharacterized protein n=1 Tax=Effrenium voratum TaxID=2562239 RepID=A0AA36JNK5_9DINO|nr:unnamed protein product [Effrenium voratum]